MTPPLPSEASAERLYLRVAAQLQARIAQGEFPVGQRLPPERLLAERFEVSRNSLREAIIALELQGLVEVRGGSGIYVCRQQMEAARARGFALEVGPGPFELLRARSLIESEIAAQAALWRHDSHLDSILAALRAMREHMADKALNEAADRSFHLHIAAACGNSVLLQIATALWDHAKTPLWLQLESHFHSTALREASQADHQLIFNALLARDANGARLAMQAHIGRVTDEFAQAWK